MDKYSSSGENWKGFETKEECKELLPPFPEGEREELKESIKEGYWQSEPNIVDQKNCIVAGYNRFEICKEGDVKPEWEVRKFESGVEVRDFTNREQISREKHSRCR